MRTYIFTLIVFFLTVIHMKSQELPDTAYELYPALSAMRGFAVGTYEDKLLIFGGTIKSDIPDLYDQDFPNFEILIIDLGNRRAIAYNSGNLGGILSAQMAATGLAFYQKEQMLYLIGGYGYSEMHRSFITFPYLTVVDLAAVVPALLEARNPAPYFCQIEDERLAIFDATLDQNDDIFFLINGKYAQKLNPFEETPAYHEEDRMGEAFTFRLVGNKDTLGIRDLMSWFDVNDLRDYYGALLPSNIEKEINRANQKRMNQ